MTKKWSYNPSNQYGIKLTVCRCNQNGLFPTRHFHLQKVVCFWIRWVYGINLWLHSVPVEGKGGFVLIPYNQNRVLHRKKGAKTMMSRYDILQEITQDSEFAAGISSLCLSLRVCLYVCIFTIIYTLEVRRRFYKQPFMERLFSESFVQRRLFKV